MDHARPRTALLGALDRENVVSTLSSKHGFALIALLTGLSALPLGCRGIIGVEERTFLEEVSCEHYCDLIQEQCTGEDVQYASTEACVAMCATFELGAIGDVEKNSVGCRVRVLNTIAENKEVELCKSLGPSGGGLCGSDCDAYCRSIEALCPKQFATFEGECATKCPKFQACGGFVADADRNDDSLQCRVFHLTSASLDPTTHCPHSIAEGHCFEAALACPTKP